MIPMLLRRKRASGPAPSESGIKVFYPDDRTAGGWSWSDSLSRSFVFSGIGGVWIIDWGKISLNRTFTGTLSSAVLEAKFMFASQCSGALVMKSESDSIELRATTVGSNRSYELRVFVNGTQVFLGSGSAGTNKHLLKITKTGNSFKFYAEGVLKHSLTNSSDLDSMEAYVDMPTYLSGNTSGFDDMNWSVN